jgi:hypothetical protein
MRDDTDGSNRVTRRKLLALTATATAALVNGGGAILDPLESEPTPAQSPPPDTNTDPKPSDDDSESEPEPDPDPGENILDYGAAPNPKDPGTRAAAANLSALRAAANAAGRGGTIYVPEGTYYYGHDGSGARFLNIYGYREPAGISIIGDGPERSVLAVSEHMPDSQNHDGFYWWEDHDHGDVTIEQITLDGNYEQLGDLTAASSGSRGLIIRDGASGTFGLANVRLRGWYTTALRLADVPGTAVNCSFEENAIGIHENTEGESVAHHANIRPARGNEFVFRRCYFARCSGDAVNISKNEGRITLQRCYGESLGNGVHKISGGDVITHEHCYWEPHTEWLENNLTESVLEFPFYGRNMIHRLTANTSVTPTLRLNNVEVRRTTARAISVTTDGLTLEADTVAFHDNALRHRDHCFNSEGSDSGITFDVGQISVHDTRGQVFNCDSSSGRIADLIHDNNEELGETGDITIAAATEGGEPLTPDVPDRDQVGIIPQPRTESLVLLPSDYLSTT